MLSYLLVTSIANTVLSYNTWLPNTIGRSLACSHTRIWLHKQLSRSPHQESFNYSLNDDNVGSLRYIHQKHKGAGGEIYIGFTSSSLHRRGSPDSIPGSAFPHENLLCEFHLSISLGACLTRNIKCQTAPRINAAHFVHLHNTAQAWELLSLFFIMHPFAG